MNNSGLPLKITTAFASSDSYKSTIPEVATSGSTGTLATGAASMDVGFPPLTRIPPSSGGIPPHGEDMNGILYSVTNKLQAYDAGAKYPFDSSFAAKISGYANGAIVASSDLAGVWLSTVDANLNNPEGIATTSTNWIPLSFTGISAISIPDANVTMTCLSAARPTLILTGTLTANRYLYIPAWAKEWTVINNCTGLFNVIISTVSGSNTASIQNGKSALIYCDGSSVSLINTVQNATNVTAGVVKIVDNLLSTATDAALTANQGYILNNKMLGIDQSWQDVTSSRAANTTYTNNTNRPIQVNISIKDNGSTGITFLVDGVTIIKSNDLYQVDFLVSAIIPINSTYRLSMTQNAIDIWAELR